VVTRELKEKGIKRGRLGFPVLWRKKIDHMARGPAGKQHGKKLGVVRKEAGELRERQALCGARSSPMS